MFAKNVATLFVLATIMALPWAVNLAHAQYVRGGLVGYWSFDNIKGKTVINDAGGNHGIINGTPKIIKGKVGNALRFGGKSDFVEVQDSAALNFGLGDFSICAWVKFKERGRNDGNAGMVGKGRTLGCGNCGTKKRFVLMYDNRANNFALGLGDGVVSGSLHFGKTVDKTYKDQWVHLAISADRDGSVAGFIDGVETVRGNFKHVSQSISTPDNLYLGEMRGEKGGKYPFNGSLDEILIYNRVLNGDEIKTNFAVQAPILAVTDSPDKLAVTWGKIKTLK